MADYHDASYQSERLCPLCMEELDETDRNFFPCECGYQVCLWCLHYIRDNMTNQCPACRQTYVETKFRHEKPKVPPEITKLPAKPITKVKAKETAPKEPVETEARKAHLVQLANYRDVRVIQRNLVYVIGLPSSIAVKEVLEKREFFGQYGTVQHLVVNRTHSYSPQWTGPSFAVYVTYASSDEAVKAITDVDGASYEGRVLRASFGTTKYCSYFLRGQQCPNLDCFYLHHLGSEEDSFTREEMLSAKHQFYDLAFPTRLIGDMQRQHVPVNKNSSFGKSEEAPKITLDEKAESTRTKGKSESETRVAGSWASVAAGRLTSSPVLETAEPPVLNATQFPLPHSESRISQRVTSSNTTLSTSNLKKRKSKKKGKGRSADDEMSDSKDEDVRLSKNALEEQREPQPPPPVDVGSTRQLGPPGLTSSSDLPPLVSLAGSNYAPPSSGVPFVFPPTTAAAVPLPPPPPLPPPAAQPVFFDAAFLPASGPYRASDSLHGRQPSPPSWLSPLYGQPSWPVFRAPGDPDSAGYHHVQFSDARGDIEPVGGGSPLLQRLFEFDRKMHGDIAGQKGVVSERLGALAWLAMSSSSDRQETDLGPSDPYFSVKHPTFAPPPGLVPVRWAPEGSSGPSVFSADKILSRPDSAERGLAILRSLMPHATIALAPQNRQNNIEQPPRQLPSPGWVDGPFGPVRQSLTPAGSGGPTPPPKS